MPQFKFTYFLKVSIFLFLFNGCSGCCGGEDRFYYRFAEISVQRAFLDENATIGSEDVVESNAVLYLEMFHEEEYIASTKFDPLFTNKALALSCISAGEYGIKDTISSIEIISNHDFLDVSSGENLIQYFIPLVQSSENGEPQTTETTFDEYRTYLNSILYDSAHYLRLNQRPEEDSTHSFKLILHDCNGSIESPFTDTFTFH